MSYILDALKKSEQDRKQGEVPGLNSFQGQPRPPRATSRIILYLLIAALLINAMVLGVWVVTRQPGEQLATTDLTESVASKIDKPLTEEADPTRSAEMIIESVPAITTPPPTKPTAQPDNKAAKMDSVRLIEPESQTDITEDDPTEEEGEDTPPKLVKYSDLPSDVRSDLGELSISAHYYANDPTARMVSINGRIMRQGKSVKSGIVLDEITRQGVIINFRKYRFSMDVFKR